MPRRVSKHAPRAHARSRRSPGATQFRYSFQKILGGSDLSRRRLPYMEARSRIDGPTVWLTACCHGDEVGGIVVVQEVFKWLRHVPLKCGSVRAFPLMNPLGFEAGARHVPFSKEDLNRSFPGNPHGTLAERIADRIFRSIHETKPAVVLDLHNDWIRSIPYSVLDLMPPGAGADLAGHLVELAEVTGFLVVQERTWLQRSLSHSLIAAGIPALTVELGESYVVNENNVELGKRSIANVLSNLGMVETGDEPFRFSSADSVIGRRLWYSHLPFSSTSGILRFLVKPGTLVRGGQPVAKVYNAFGRLQETLRALNDGIVVGLSDSSVAFPGAPVMAFGELSESSSP